MLNIQIKKDFHNGYLLGLIVGLYGVTIEEVTEGAEWYNFVLKCDSDKKSSLLKMLDSIIIKGE